MIGEKKYKYLLRREQGLIMENSTGKKKDIFENYKVENIKGMAQMTDTWGQILQTQAHTFKTWEKGNTQCTNKMFKDCTKKFLQTLEHE